MKSTRILSAALAASSVVAALSGCGEPSPPSVTPTHKPESGALAMFKAGGLYSCESGGGKFCVVKVLVAKDGGVHARLYSNEYSQRPTAVELDTLKVELGHAPLSEAGFRNWKPILISEQPVLDSELEGYRLWLANR